MTMGSKIDTYVYKGAGALTNIAYKRNQNCDLAKVVELGVWTRVGALVWDKVYIYNIYMVVTIIFWKNFS